MALHVHSGQDQTTAESGGSGAHSEPGVNPYRGLAELRGSESERVRAGYQPNPADDPATGDKVLPGETRRENRQVLAGEDSGPG
ncbi:hypothetical protein AOLI_G00322100 [Acnodon oligacanthus]